MNWVIIVTFAFSSGVTQDIVRYTYLQLEQPIRTEVVRDTQGRVVMFPDAATCQQVAVKVIDAMMTDPNVRPFGAKCVLVKNETE